MQIIHREFINERDSRNSYPDLYSTLRNIDNLTDMGFNLTRFSPIPIVGDTLPQIPRLIGGFHLHNSDLTSNREHSHAPNLHNSFSELQRQFDPQKLTGPQLGPKSLGTNDSTLTFNTTKFYPGEIPFRNQGMSPASMQHAEPVGM